MNDDSNKPTDTEPQLPPVPPGHKAVAQIVLGPTGLKFNTIMPLPATLQALGAIIQNLLGNVAAALTPPQEKSRIVMANGPLPPPRLVK